MVLLKTRTVLIMVFFILFLVCMMNSVSAWWDNNWGYRKEITIDHDQIPDSLEYFPLLINLSGSNVFNKILSDGRDIAFIAGNDSYQFNHEIESIDTVAQTGHVWVNVTRVTGATNTTLYLYYNNSAAAAQWDNTSTWHSNYVLVCHMNTSFDDSTINGNDGTEQTVIPPVDGVAAYGQDFEHDDHDYVNYSLVGDHNAFSIEFWHTIETLNVDKYSIGNKGDFSFLVKTDGKMEFEVGSDKADSGTLVYDEGPWFYTVGTCDGANINIFTNGVNKDTTPCTVNLNTPFWVGMEQDNGGDDWYDGVIDEFRISKVAWNSSWITTTYNSIVNGSDGGFFSFGPETSKFNNSPLISVYNPVNNSVVYDTSTINVSVYIEDVEGDLFNYTIETSPDIGHRYGNWSSNGTKIANVSGLKYGTTYSVFVNTTDYYGSGNWTNRTYYFTVNGGLEFWCYNENNMSNTIGFDLIISNQDGTEVYTASDLTSGSSINTSVMPTGENTVFIVSNSSYKTRVYYYDVTETTYYNLSFYLPLLKDDDILYYSSKGVTDSTSDVVVSLECEPDRIVLVQGWNESLYGHWFMIPDDNYTLVGDTLTMSSDMLDLNTTVVQVQYYCSNNVLDYIIHVVDSIGNVLNDAKVNVKRLDNDTYMNMTSVLTDGNGDATVFLIPDEHYRIIISKSGYVTSYADYLPSEAVRTKTYKLDRETDETNVTHWLHDISINAEFTNGCTLFLNYTDHRFNTTSVNVTVERWNGSSYNSTVYYYNDTLDSFSVSTHLICDFAYRVVFTIDHGDHGLFNHTILLNNANLSVTSVSELENKFTEILGSNPFGWVNFFAIFFMLACLFSFGEVGAGISLLGTGFGLLFLNVLIVGFIASTMVPILFIVLGMMVEWKHARRNA